MKTDRIPKAVALALALALPEAHAQLAVAIAADPARDFHWTLEDNRWSSLTASNDTIAQNTNELVRNTTELLSRIGTTEGAVSNVSATIPRSTDSLRTAVALPSRIDTLNTATQHYSVGQFPLDDKNNQVYAVRSTYDAFGQQQKRDDARYASFAAEQAMNDRFQTAAVNAEKVESEELEVQAQAVDQLKAATTQAEIEVCQLAVETSKGRIELAHAKLKQARDEMDEYLARVDIEKERKAEADREWTTAVVAGLRDRALKAYQAQSGSTDDRPGS